MKANHIIIVPETHWDREWYLPFQAYRARLVLMMDKLLDILRNNPEYANFTLDGQTIPIEDYLEVRPEKKAEIKKFVKEKRLSIGPMYILPDEFLISGESMIRNLMIGHKIAQRFGRVMKAGYIPDPFGHIAQLPQILSGFELPSVLFWRGFGNEFVDNNLNVEFKWNAPGNAASILAIHLILSYGSLADLKTTKGKNGVYKRALSKIKRVISKFEKHTITPIALLNSGSDHHEAKPEIPEIVKQWNEQNPEQLLEQNDFEYYVEQVLAHEPNLKSFTGELRGGRYGHLLSGVFSARMWIKQRNTEIEYLYEKYAEPLSTITWALDKGNMFQYPHAYLLTGLKWLIKNHPHDSICGCSIDQVHDEMKIRFDWAEQIAEEVYKSSFIHLSELIEIDEQDHDRFALIVFNPLPWKRMDRVDFNCVSIRTEGDEFPDVIKIIDSKGNEIPFQHHFVKEEPKHTQIYNISHEFTFLADVPSCGYKVYYVVPIDEESKGLTMSEGLSLMNNSIENEFYKVSIEKNGQINVLHKASGILHEGTCDFEDMGDWGDEYDFSGPFENQVDIKYSTLNTEVIEIVPFLDGPTQKTINITMKLKLPTSLNGNRSKRNEDLADNFISLYISLYKGIKRIDFKIELENRSKDHRIRVIFPTNIKSEEIHADGHFYVVPRSVDIPDVKGWAQLPLPTNHQKDFVAISDDSRCVAVLNKGLPEYEAIKNKDGTISFAITLLRCIEWLSRGDFITRKSNAGPDLNTPGAQCIGKHVFELALVIDSNNSWLDANIQLKGKEFNNPLKPIIPFSTKTPMRIMDKLILSPLGVLSYFLSPQEKKIKPHLPLELSFLELDNDKIQLSALKKSEEGNHLIIRCFNISSTPQKGLLRLYEGLKIINVEIVNFLEEKPQNEVKASSRVIDGRFIELILEPHVIATIKLEFVVK